MTHLHHVTLTSGDVARHRRDSFDGSAIAAAATLLDSILTGGKPEVSPGYRAFGSHSGHSLLVTLVGPDDAPILTTGVALRSRSAPRLWRMLHDRPSLPIVTDPAAPPPAPWIADRLEIGAATDEVATTWTGRWAACVGWAWLEYDR